MNLSRLLSSRRDFFAVKCELTEMYARHVYIYSHGTYMVQH